jgi:lipopolysaccharide heptosyltransferase II
MESFDRILVHLPTWLGDVVMATPLLRTLKENCPRAHVAVLCRKAGALVLEGLPGIDEVILYEKGGRHGGLRGTLRLAKDLRGRRFDLAVCCPNSMRSALMLALARIPRRVGWAYGGRGFLLTDRLVPDMRGHRRTPRPMPQYYLDLARHLGCETFTDHSRLGVTQPGLDEVAEFRRVKGIAETDRLVGFNVGAAFGPSKHWTARGFAETAAGLRERHGMRPVVLCGPGEEELGREIEEAVGGDVVRTSDHVLSLPGLKALVSQLAFMVSTDTGPRHFAIGFDIPHVCVMGSTDPMMTDQPHARGEVVRLRPLLDCMPCHEKVCPLVHHKCLEDLPASAVLAAVERVLALPPLEDAVEPPPREAR